MSTQPSAAAEHRGHCRVATTVVLQTPSSTPSVSPSTGLPETAGSVSTVGGTTGGSPPPLAGGGAAAATTTVAAETADAPAEPSVAVTAMRTVAPTSAAPRR